MRLIRAISVYSAFSLYKMVGLGSLIIRSVAVLSFSAAWDLVEGADVFGACSVAGLSVGTFQRFNVSSSEQEKKTITKDRPQPTDKKPEL
jgi:hypothetical protein